MNIVRLKFQNYKASARLLDQGGNLGPELLTSLRFTTPSAAEGEAREALRKLKIDPQAVLWERHEKID